MSHHGTDATGTGPTAQEKRIAELEAELAQMTIYRDNARQHMEWLRDERDSARAELAALKGRRCETCDSWRFWLTPLGPNETICTNEVMDGVCDKDGNNPPADFACNRWAERGTKK